MNKQLKDSFRNSSLGRAKTPKRFHSFIDDKLKRHRSDTGLVEDRTGSTTVVRTIFGLILVHLVVIGGVFAHGKLANGHPAVSMGASVTPPPSAPVAPEQNVVPQPAVTAEPLPALSESPTAAQSTATPALVQPVVVTPAPSKPVSSAAAATPHITQMPADDVAEEVATPPVKTVQPVVAAPAQETKPAAPATPANVRTVTAKHHVASGDSWIRVAAQYNITVEALKAANPKAAAKNTLFAGTYLDVPLPADSEAGKAIAATQAQEAVVAKGTVHVVKKGESLGLIAKKYKISLNKLYELNNMTPADAKKLKVGAELKVAD